MSMLSKQINEFFSVATKEDAEKVINNMLINDHLKKVLYMKYIEGKDIEFIAYKTGYSKAKINADLAKIRRKISKALGTSDS